MHSKESAEVHLANGADVSGSQQPRGGQVVQMRLESLHVACTQPTAHIETKPCYHTLDPSRHCTVCDSGEWRGLCGSCVQLPRRRKPHSPLCVAVRAHTIQGGRQHTNCVRVEQPQAVAPEATHPYEAVCVAAVCLSLWKAARHGAMGRFECKDCGKQFTFQGNLHRHAKTHTLGPQTCNKCGKSFSQKRLLTQHLSRTSCRLVCVSEIAGMLRPHKCVECGRNFSKPESLAAHTATHKTGASASTCDVCGKHFPTWQELKHHHVIHTGAKDFMCVQCGRAYTQKGSLNKHISSSHGGIKTEEDGEDVVLPAHITDGRRRYRAHGGDRKHKCEECGCGFTSLDVLRKHYAIHFTQKPFKCEECGKSYTRKDVLASHMLQHSKTREFTCGHCGKQFWHKGLLRQHVVTHLPPQFKCEDCGKEFTFKINLKNHQRGHSGVKEFDCGECGKAFVLKNYLVKHIRKVHNREQVV
ncbi:Zinc finger protein 708 [Chionoecetes opilio]|uniref:Zinc finger protein 708 n=1 Tax=Chionoecetes opilio TaxID=41210 RepID=A0A8J4XZE0_CHIOP|nr:Zinc finger protein 708 [Chionoecetes opilio]